MRVLSVARPTDRPTTRLPACLPRQADAPRRTSPQFSCTGSTPEIWSIDSTRAPHFFTRSRSSCSRSASGVGWVGGWVDGRTHRCAPPPLDAVLSFIPPSRALPPLLAHLPCDRASGLPRGAAPAAALHPHHHHHHSSDPRALPPLRCPPRRLSVAARATVSRDARAHSHSPTAIDHVHTHCHLP